MIASMCFRYKRPAEKTGWPNRWVCRDVYLAASENINININPRWIRFDLHKVLSFGRRRQCVRDILSQETLLDFFYFAALHPLRNAIGVYKSILGYFVVFPLKLCKIHGMVLPTRGAICTYKYRYLFALVDGRRSFACLCSHCSSNMTGYIRWIFKWHQSNWKRISQAMAKPTRVHLRMWFWWWVTKQMEEISIYFLWRVCVCCVLGLSLSLSFFLSLYLSLSPPISLSRYFRLQLILWPWPTKYINRVHFSAYVSFLVSFGKTCMLLCSYNCKRTSHRKLSCKLKLIGSTSVTSRHRKYRHSSLCVSIMAFNVNNFKRLSTMVAPK